jgi:hypothetical protein
MRRRAFIAALGSAAAWPYVARAQQPGKVARIGLLGAASASAYARQVEGFRSGLRDLSYIEGRCTAGRRASTSGLPNWRRVSFVPMWT